MAHLDPRVHLIKDLLFFPQVLSALHEHVFLRRVHREEKVVKKCEQAEEYAEGKVLDPVVASINHDPCDVAQRLCHGPHGHDLMEQPHREPIEHLEEYDQVNA